MQSITLAMRSKVTTIEQLMSCKQESGLCGPRYCILTKGYWEWTTTSTLLEGDSISAIHLASAARESGLQLLATDIIRNPTICAMAHIAESAVLNRDFDEDDMPSLNLAQMAPRDLTLLDLDDSGLDRLRDELLKKHGLSARLVSLIMLVLVLKRSSSAT